MIRLALLALLVASPCAQDVAPEASAPEAAEPCRSRCWIELRLDSPTGPRWTIEVKGWPGRKVAVTMARGPDGLEYYVAPLPSVPCVPGQSKLCHRAALLWRRCSIGEPPCIPGRQLLGGQREGRPIHRIRFLESSSHEDEEVDESWMQIQDL